MRNYWAGFLLGSAGVAALFLGYLIWRMERGLLGPGSVLLWALAWLAVGLAGVWLYKGKDSA